MNQSTYPPGVAASAVSELLTEFDRRAAEVLRQMREVVGSFFGGRALARRDAAVGAGLGKVDARTCPHGDRSDVQCSGTR